MNPSSLMKLTAIAISSACAASMRRGEPPLFNVATQLPYASQKVSLANCLTYSSQTRWPRTSWPEGLAVLTSVFRKSSDDSSMGRTMKFKVQSSKFKVQSSKVKGQSSKVKVQVPTPPPFAVVGQSIVPGPPTMRYRVGFEVWDFS